ncbi:hypothetical protein Hamer_G000926 [Homarus americanus]|uniref:Uncharacterized protein n=1 Tax=Homarus americanus TaxID=6706 RepID=A0A8J5N2I6_HOMAM|nr:hypothetical protein Hamer_G000926 [Homarus americanus]
MCVSSAGQSSLVPGDQPHHLQGRGVRVSGLHQPQDFLPVLLAVKLCAGVALSVPLAVEVRCTLPVLLAVEGKVALPVLAVEGKVPDRPLAVEGKVALPVPPSCGRLGGPARPPSCEDGPACSPSCEGQDRGPGGGVHPEGLHHPPHLPVTTTPTTSAPSTGSAKRLAISVYLTGVSPRGGVSVEIEKTPARTTSKLFLTRAGKDDLGNYTCVPQFADPASVLVHVVNGESW